MDWRELGGVGHVGLVGIVLACILSITLGYRIESVARSDLLSHRADVLSRVVDDLPSNISDLEPGTAEYDTFDTTVARSLLGGEAVRVKVWTPDGTIIYSDVPALVGIKFDPAPDRQAAFTGKASNDTADLDGPENVYDQGFGSVLEFYVPLRDPSGTVVAVVEVYEHSDSLNASLARIRVEVWWSVGVGLAVMALFIGGLTVGVARALNRRRNQAEDLTTTLVLTREEERRRLVTALHDDVSQPLYRILFGIQGCRQRINDQSGNDQSVSEELNRLEELTRGVETSIRTQLRNLHGSTVEEMGFESAVDQLIATTRAETDLDVRLRVDEKVDLPTATGSAMYKALQESVFNVRRHADASSMGIVISSVGGEVTAHVSDDGVGWNGSEGIGLTTARRVLRTVDGDLKIDVRRPHGTVTCIRVPRSRAST